MTIYTSPYDSVPTPDESIFTFLFETKNNFPGDTPAFIDAPSGKVITRAQLKELALSLGWGLRNHFANLGGVPLNRGDTILIFSPNSISWPIILFAGAAAGLRMALANSAYTPAELKFQYVDSGAKAAFVHPTLLPTAMAMFELAKVDARDVPKRIITADWDESPSSKGLIRLDDLLGKGKLGQEEKFPGSQSNETVYLCYSSGTTGQPKGVEVGPSHYPFVGAI